jgi:hypothetical protein
MLLNAFSASPFFVGNQSFIFSLFLSVPQSKLEGKNWGRRISLAKTVLLFIQFTSLLHFQYVSEKITRKFSNFNFHKEFKEVQGNGTLEWSCFGERFML